MERQQVLINITIRSVSIFENTFYNQVFLELMEHAGILKTFKYKVHKDCSCLVGDPLPTSPLQTVFGTSLIHLRGRSLMHLFTELYATAEKHEGMQSCFEQQQCCTPKIRARSPCQQNKI